MALHLQNIHTELRVPTRALKRWAEEVLREEGVTGGTFSITLVDDAHIRELNRAYLKKDRPTDVLAFPVGHPPNAPSGSRIILGDIYVSLDRAREQSVAYEVPFRSEVLRLMLHGIYHILGYSHKGMARLVEEHVAQSEKVEPA